MILQQILELFDEELDRLDRLRSIVSGLQRPSVLTEARALTSAALPPLSAPPEEPGPGSADLVAPPETQEKRKRPTQKPVARSPARAARVSRSSTKSREEISALRGVIPAGPVVVPAARVRITDKKVSSPPVASSAPASASASSKHGSLGSMIRALRLEQHL